MWFPLALLSALFFSLMWVFARMSRGVPSSIVTALEFSVGPFFLVYSLRTVSYPWGEAWWQWYLLLPFCILPVTLWGLTYAVQQNQVTVVKPLSATSSIATLLVALVFFQERISFMGIFGVLIVTMGLLCLYHGRWNVWKTPGPWIALAGSLVLGTNAAIVAAVLSRFPHIIALAALVMTGGFVVNGIFAGRLWFRVQWTWYHAGVIFCLIVSMVVQDLLTLYAFTLGPSAYVIAVKRTSVLITAVIGYVFLHERDQSFWQLLGSSALVVLGMIMLVLL
jgi:drug/metabolite transporter (DMT)-like permease